MESKQDNKINVPDSITVFEGFLVKGELLFAIVQDSIRFEKFKILVIRCDNDTHRGEYLGTYRVVSKSVFRLKSISKMISLMFFGVHEEEGKRRLRGFKVKGKKSDEMKFAIVCFELLEVNERWL